MVRELNSRVAVRGVRGIVGRLTALFGARRETDVVPVASSTPRALLVGDSERTRLELTRILSAAGFAIEEATSRKQAIQKLKRLHPVLAIVDARVEGKVGADFVRAMRQRHDFDTTRVMMILPLATPWHLGSAMGAGADAHLSKPIYTNAVLQKVRSMLPACAVDHFA
jgi:two-component system, chemotaxis family, chemotaxis protein CheY